MKGFLLKSFLKWLFSIFLFFSLLMISFASGAFLYQKKYAGKIFPGVKIGALSLGGMTLEQAKEYIQKTSDDIIREKILFSYNNKDIPLSFISSTPDLSSSKEIISYDVEQMTQNAYNLGRSKKKVCYDFFNELGLFFYGKKLLPLYTLNDKEMSEALKINFSSLEKPAKNALLTITEDYAISIQEETYGYEINYEQGILSLIQELDKFSVHPIKIALSSIKDSPEIKKQDSLTSIEEAKKLLELTPIKLKYQDKEWILNKEAIRNWISLALPEENQNATSTKFHYVTINSPGLKGYLEKTIAPQVNMPPQNAKFEIKDGRVIEFQASKDGLEMDLAQNCDFISAKVLQEQKEIELIMKEIKSAVSNENVNDLGIKEIVGIGKSNFKGSPKNRTKNIKVGADILKGVLIEPGKEFSINAALGEIDGKHGFLPELVIKGNKTIPEYGGGLCQIGTTLFRAALNSGFQITERRNHSYRVSYYEPAGTDATIYSPHPDLKFINDTANYILIQTKVEGTELTFELWGTRDGRIVEQSEPKIYNIRKPGPTKFIETDTLQPSQKKCTESAHNGADATFHHKVTYTDGTVKERDFTSHYQPWQAVCLIGKNKPAGDATASSTAETLQ